MRGPVTAARASWFQASTAWTSFVVFVLVAGCRPARPTELARVVGGERRAGTFVSPYAYEHFLRAELATARGDDVTAAEEYALARLGPSDDALVAARQAEALDRLGRLERADATLEEARSVDPSSEAVALATSRIAERRGDDETALREAVRATEHAPDSLVAWRRVAELAVETDRAPALLQRLGDDPASVRARLVLAIDARDALEAEAALESLQRVASVRRDEVAEVVELALARGRPALAAHLAERLVNGSAHATLRVRAYLALGRHADAEGILASEPPSAFGGPLATAELWLRAGRPERSVDLAQEAAALGDPAASVVLAEAHLALGELSEAATVASSVPRDLGEAARARRVLREALMRAGLPALAAEVETGSREATFARGR